MESLSFIDRVRRLLGGKLERDEDAGTAAESDLSYEDALLGLQLRHYFKAEYGIAEPPARVLPRLIAAIQAHERGQAATEASRPVAVLASVYRALRTDTAQQLVSGGVAAAVMIAVLSSSSAQYLRGTAISFVRGEATPTASAVISSQDVVELATERDERYVLHLPESTNDPEFYDPAERRMPARAASASGSTAPARWQRMGGQ
jgi:hypothetical protein